MKGSDTSRKSSATSQTVNSFGLTQGYNFYIIAKYHTPIQDQGQEGACTAFGITHTIQANMQKLVPGFTSSATNQWSLQGMQPYVSQAIEVAMQQTYQGHKITKNQKIETIDQIKATMDQGRAVYAASEVDDKWTNSGYKGGPLTCGNANGAAGHAYSLHGYDDAKQWFIVKNSWGDGWGESGYGYLPYSCITSFQTGDFHDLPIQ